MKPSNQSLKLAKKLAKFFGECGIDYTKQDVNSAALDIDKLIKAELEDCLRIANSNCDGGCGTVYMIDQKLGDRPCVKCGKDSKFMSPDYLCETHWLEWFNAKPKTKKVKKKQ